MNAPNLINKDELEKKLEASPAERVTLDGMKARIVSTDFTRIGETVTLCNLTLDNGYSVRGESACVNPENYNKEIGEKISYENAISKLWPLFGFALAEKNLNNKKAA